MEASGLEMKESLLEAIENGNLLQVTKIVNQFGLLSYCTDLLGGYFLLCKAIQYRRFNVAHFLLEKGAKVNSESDSSPLHLAVEERCNKMVELLLKYGAEINCLRTSDNFTPLHISCDKNCIDLVSNLLSNGADPNIKAYDDSTPLHLAADRGVSSITELLIERGAQVNWSRLSDKYTPLHVACKKSKRKCVSALLKSGADVNAKAIDNTTPLIVAIQEKNLEIIEILLKHGADVNCSRLSDKFTPLHIACKDHRNEYIQVLLENGADANSKVGSNNLTPLFIAIGKRNVEAVEVLLKHGAEVNCSRFPDKYTPLHVACNMEDNDTCVNTLLKYGADVNAKATDNVTPFFLAVDMQSTDIVKILLKHGAQTDCSRLKDNYTPLHIACKDDSTHLVKYLLNLGADPNIKVKNNVTPLHLAVAGELSPSGIIVEALLEHGAQVNCQRLPDNFTPLHIACKEGWTSIVDLLLNHGADANILANNNVLPIHLSVESCKLKIVESLVKHGAKLNCFRREPEKAPLHLACYLRSPVEMINILLKHGADPNIKTTNDETPLHILAQGEGCYNYRQTERKVELLIEYGGRVNCARFSDNYTPLHLACDKGHTAAVDFLLNSRANPNIRAKNSRTPLHLAVQKGCFDTVRSLLFKPGLEINCPRLPSNYTPLRIACAKRHYSVVDELLNHGADPNVRARDCSTPLHFVVIKGYREIVVQLLNYSADINVETRKGSTPLHLALKSRSRKRIADVLKRHSIKLNVAGLYVSKKILQLLQLKSEELIDFELECEEEVRRMMSKQVTGHFSIHDILKNRQNPVYTKNDSLMQLLQSLNYEEFPNYKSLLLDCLNKGKQRFVLLTSAEKWLNVLLKTSNLLNGKRFRNLPAELLVEINSYLNDEELRSLIACGENLERQLRNVNCLFS